MTKRAKHRIFGDNLSNGISDEVHLGRSIALIYWEAQEFIL